MCEGALSGERLAIVPPRSAAITMSAASDGALVTTDHSSALNATLVVMGMQCCAA
jgi:hypothetical protein